jgi:hypothetical protein
VAKRRECTREGCEEPKARGNASLCIEDWLIKQPMQVQIKHAQARLAMVPPALRLARVPSEQWPEGRRWCSGCQSFIRLEDCTGTRCKACAAAASREYRLETQYSLSPLEYQRLFVAQDGRCYLCGRKSPSRPLAPDHNHVTGEVRGLLCPDPDWGCNLKIVARADSYPGGALAFAIRMVEYFRNPPARKVLHDE